MSQKTLWTILGVTILVFIAGLVIGLWTIPVRAPADESTPQTSVEASASGEAKAAQKAQNAENGEQREEVKQNDETPADDERAAENAEDGEKSEHSDNLIEEQEKGGDE